MYKVKSKKRLVICLPLIFILALCIYVGIYHSHRYYGFDSNLWLTIIELLTIIVLLSMFFNLNERSRWYKMRLFLLVILIGGPICVMVIIKHQSYVNKHLANNCEKVSGVVIELFSRSAKTGTTPYALFAYQMNRKTWKQIIRNENINLKVGDTIHLKCSKDDPEVFMRLVD